MSEHLDSPPGPVPGTPGINEIRSDLVSDCDRGGATSTNFGLRAEIDTSPPFASVKEAVTRFGGSGPWVPCYRIGDDFGEIDIKKVEEQAAELEKDLIVKELETLDVLEELGTTKKIVEDFKLQLQKEALRCITIPAPAPAPDHHHISTPAATIKTANKENNHTHHHLHHYLYEHQRLMGTPCPSSSPDMILMELKQAKLNLGKTIHHLGVIQTSIDSLNKNMKQERTFLQNTRKRLTSKFAGVLSLEEELKQARRKPDTEQFKTITEVSKPEISMIGQSKVDLRTAELRLLAARKMEEAARAAEAVALAEIKSLSNSESPCGFSLPEPEKPAKPPSQPRKAEGTIIPHRRSEPVSKLTKYEPSNSKMQILKKMREATEEVRRSKQALEDALNKVEIASRKQFEAEEAFLKWIPEDDHDSAAYYNPRLGNMQFFRPDHCQDSPLHQVKKSSVAVDEPKPVLRPTVSMRDFLGRKQQVVTEDYAPTARPMEAAAGGRTGRQKVALSQMLHEIRDDLTFHPRPPKHEGGDQKQFFTQRRKFGFIHISLPMSKPSKKKDTRFE